MTELEEQASSPVMDVIRSRPIPCRRAAAGHCGPQAAAILHSQQPQRPQCCACPLLLAEETRRAAHGAVLRQRAVVSHDVRPVSDCIASPSIARSGSPRPRRFPACARPCAAGAAAPRLSRCGRLAPLPKPRRRSGAERWPQGFVFLAVLTRLSARAPHELLFSFFPALRRRR